MNAPGRVGPASEDAVSFEGDWREYLPIALTNLALTIVTLGIYRFWAIARTRRYLWSRTRVVDDHLEWTGTGKEMFVGFLAVLAVFLPMVVMIQFGVVALVSRGLGALAILTIVLLYAATITLIGVAKIRGLRYRLSRTWWHGIRGGSNDKGWGYGLRYLGRALLTGLSLGFAYPAMKVRNWNERWNAMSVGNAAFDSRIDTDGLWGRWIAAMFAPFLLIMVLVVAVGLDAMAAAETPIGAFVGLLLFYTLVPIIYLGFFAKFYRNAAEGLSLGDLRFSFEARTGQWIMLFLSNLALAVVTLGLGALFWQYRTHAFVTRHLHLEGALDAALLEQSSTHAPAEAEGFSDAFDVGVF